MATIINFVTTAILTATLALGSVEVIDANRVEIKDWSTGGVPAQAVCTREEGGEWSVFICVTTDLDPEDLSVEGHVENIEETMTLSFEADDEAITDMIAQARQQGATVEVS